MYIRRKVFSLGVNQETGEEKLFSTTEYKTQKEFAEKKESEGKAEKISKAAAIGGAGVGLGAGVAGLSLNQKKLLEKIEEAELKKGALDNVKEIRIAAGLDSSSAKRESDKLARKIKTLKVAEKLSKHSGKIGLAGVGTSIGGGVAYKALKKKKDQKEFAEKEENKAKKAGKVMAGVGAATALGGGLVANHEIDKAVTKVANDRALEKSGYGITSKVKGNAKSVLSKVSPMSEAKNILKSSGKYKIAKGTALGGLALGAAGTGTYLYGKHKAKKGEDQKKITDKEFSDNKDENKKIKTAGKVMAGVGAATYTGSNGTEAKLKAKVLKMIENKEADVVGDSLKFKSQKDAESAEKFLKEADKALKVTNKGKKLGLALTAAGAGTYLVGRHKSKKAEEKKKD